MEDTLKKWVLCVCTDLLQIPDADCNLFSDNVLSIAKHMLQEEDGSFDDHRIAVARSLHLREDDNDVMTTAAMLLKYAVSVNCIMKSEYVNHIIKMSSGMQEELMKIIQDESMTRSDDEDDENDEEDESDDDFVDEFAEEINNEEDLKNSEQENRPSKLEECCDKCQEMELDLLNHKNQVNVLLQREKELQEKLTEENTLFMNKQIDLREIIQEKEASLQERNAELQLLEDEKKELLSKVSEMDELTEKVATLQDEIDVLQPVVKRAEAAESQLSRMIDKLDKLDGVNNRLRNEVEAHNKTQEELISCKKEVEEFNVMKSQVTDYRDRCAESTIKINELTSQLELAQEEVNTLTIKLKNVSEGQKESESYNKSLTDELKVANEALRNSEFEGGIGGGVSEFNPEISKELYHLRLENTTLLSKLNKTSEESLNKLEQELADQECINKSLQQKWSNAKEDIQHLSSSIVDLKQNLSFWMTKYEIFSKEHEESLDLAAQDKLSTVFQYENKLVHARRAMQDSVYIISQGQKAVIRELHDECNDTHSKLSKTEDELSDVTAIKVKLNEELEKLGEKYQSKNDELEEECKKRKRDEEIFTEEKKRMLSAFDNEKQEITAKNKMNERKVQKEFQLQLDDERKKYVNIVADLEEEKLKRRKLVREKRFHESESHRLKTQQQMSANSNNHNSEEFESAIKEMKAMQDQLDSANKQITMLKSQVVTSDHLGNSDARSDVKLNSTETTLHSRRAQRVSQIGESLSTYQEQSEMYERKIDSLTRERRTMIAKSLEENKEVMMLNQKLLQYEKETASYKAKVTKLTLEKERLSRRLAKQADQENVPPPSTVNV